MKSGPRLNNLWSQFVLEVTTIIVIRFFFSAAYVMYGGMLWGSRITDKLLWHRKKRKTIWSTHVHNAIICAWSGEMWCRWGKLVTFFAWHGRKCIRGNVIFARFKTILLFWQFISHFFFLSESRKKLLPLTGHSATDCWALAIFLFIINYAREELRD